MIFMLLFIPTFEGESKYKIEIEVPIQLTRNSTCIECALYNKSRFLSFFLATLVVYMSFSIIIYLYELSKMNFSVLNKNTKQRTILHLGCSQGYH
jgi:hypothetical protein